ncbi:MAG: hypothetical protein SynsKO_15680 [Synoicihabitans sp.]
MILIMVGGLGIGGWYLGRPLWQDWKQGTALEQVERFTEENDYRNALLALRRATEAAPSDPRVWRKASEFLARIGSPEVVVAQRNLVRLAPGDVGLKVALVTEALRFNDFDTAAQGLEELEEGARADAAFHRLAAAVALALGREGEVVNNLRALLAKVPDDYRARFNLAAIEAWSRNSDVAAAAMVELTRLCAIPEVRVRAALERLKVAAMSRDSARVDAEVASLVRTFDPTQQGLPLLRSDANEPPGWDRLIEVLKDAAKSNADDVSRLARWMSGIGLSLEALNWLESLPVEIKESPDLSATLLDIAAQTNDLSLIREILTSGRLGPIPSRTIDLALAARIQAMEFGSNRAHPTWEDAVTTSSTSLAGLRVLARLGGIWRDRMEVNTALERIVELYPREFWACEALRVNYASQGDMEKLWRLYRLWAPRVPDNTQVQTTWVMLAAILNRVDSVHVERINEMWSSAKDPVDPALALAMVGVKWRTAPPDRAVEYFDRLPIGAEQETRVLLWRAIVSADLDDEVTLQYALRNLDREDLLDAETKLLDGVLRSREQRLQAAAIRSRAGNSSTGASALPRP